MVDCELYFHEEHAASSVNYVTRIGKTYEAVPLRRVPLGELTQSTLFGEAQNPPYPCQNAW